MKKTFLLILILISLKGFANVQTDTLKSNSLIHMVEKWYEDNMNYTSITILMTVESSFIPFPSEIVIPPAAYIASKDDSELNIYLVVLFGTLGALLGAYINYILAIWLGRPILYRLADGKLGKLFMLSSIKIKKAEEYFLKNGNISTFIGRLIPGIRQLISIPAGLARMNIWSFSLYTALGALIWNSILALIGYLTHGQAELIDKYSHEIGYLFLAVIALISIYYFYKFLKNKKK